MMSRLYHLIEEAGRRGIDTSCNACYEIIYVDVFLEAAELNVQALMRRINGLDGMSGDILQPKPCGRLAGLRLPSSRFLDM